MGEEKGIARQELKHGLEAPQLNVRNATRVATPLNLPQTAQEVNSKMQPTHFGPDNEPRPVVEIVYGMALHNYCYTSPIEQRRRINTSQVLPDYKRKKSRYRSVF